MADSLSELRVSWPVVDVVVVVVVVLAVLAILGDLGGTRGNTQKYNGDDGQDMRASETSSYALIAENIDRPAV